jgi:S-adenosyl-L-methionine hydrolase (adenosine-forming)
LLSDFGGASDYPAQMKGVILEICPEAQLVDITHRIPQYDVLVGQIFLRDAIAAFPQRSIHLAVVDPGVGTARRPIVVAGGSRGPGHLFVGPDNGLLWPFARDGEVYELADTRFRRETVSATFHGRDIFAPAAAHLALGVAPSEFGPRVLDPVPLSPPRIRFESGALIGEILYADSFGNLISNIRADDLPPEGSGPIRFSVAGRSIVGLSRTYGDGSPGDLLVLVGSSGRIEVAVREGSARSVLSLDAPRGMPLVVERATP